ncbi:MAG: hypothetical protein LIO57_10185, partial [Oscillospiraceae bacterium]|nr:hypothetical protein [Oscillospiraceae bacterium]
FLPPKTRARSTAAGPFYSPYHFNPQNLPKLPIHKKLISAVREIELIFRNADILLSLARPH